MKGKGREERGEEREWEEGKGSERGRKGGRKLEGIGIGPPKFFIPFKTGKHNSH